jgi:hypothetical protein
LFPLQRLLPLRRFLPVEGLSFFLRGFLFHLMERWAARYKKLRECRDICICYMVGYAEFLVRVRTTAFSDVLNLPLLRH